MIKDKLVIILDGFNAYGLGLLLCKVHNIGLRGTLGYAGYRISKAKTRLASGF